MEIVQQITDDKNALADKGELLSDEATKLLEDFERRSAKLEGLLQAEDLADGTQTPRGEPAREPQTGSTGEIEDLRMENSSLRDLNSSSNSQVRQFEGEIARLRGLLDENRISAAPPLPAADQELCEELGVGPDTFLKLKRSFSGEQQPTERQTPHQDDPEHKVFIAKVDMQAHGWRDIRQKPEFAAFCNTRPGGQFGPSFLDMLKDAAKTYDADTTAMVYNEFKKAAPATPYRPSREAADSRSKGGDGAPVAAETWNEEKIKKFEEDVRAGRVKRGSAKYNQLRASYDAWLSNLTVSG